MPTAEMHHEKLQTAFQSLFSAVKTFHWNTSTRAESCTIDEVVECCAKGALPMSRVAREKRAQHGGRR